MSVQVCPRCKYKRKPTDLAPEWQCPSCGIVYSKFSAQQNKPAAAKAVTPSFTKRSRLDWILNGLMLFSPIMILLAIVQQGVLPDVSTIDSSFEQHPIMTKTQRDKFTFSYRDRSYNVEPVANYELWGVVVTHNDITGMTDYVHDEDSVDIKDICVVWGDNVTNNDYMQVEYSSGDFTCFTQYEYGTQYNPRHLSNNHLLSDNQEVRDAIRDVHVGDLVYFKGMLVNYAPTSNPNWIRRSSTILYDTGKVACEVVFIEEFTVVASLNGHWYVIKSIFIWLFLLALLVKVMILYFQPSWNKTDE